MTYIFILPLRANKSELMRVKLSLINKSILIVLAVRFGSFKKKSYRDPWTKNFVHKEEKRIGTLNRRIFLPIFVDIFVFTLDCPRQFGYPDGLRGAL